MKKIIKFFRPIIIATARTYWFIFRPKTRGAKIILSCQDQILLVKPTYGYKYTLPGGGIKREESSEMGVRREVQEELGIVLGDTVYLGSFISTAEYKKDEVFAYSSELKNKEVFIDNLEIEEATWFLMSSLPTLGLVTSHILSLYKKRNAIQTNI